MNTKLATQARHAAVTLMAMSLTLNIPLTKSEKRTYDDTARLLARYYHKPVRTVRAGLLADARFYAFG